MKHPVNMKLDKEIIREAKRISKKEKKTFTQLVTDILLQHIRNYKREEHESGERI
jgi:hypothetical protein|tara:strand:+ start:11771 stop:11935 length:165 start_codon:yes stop_codon:yes gene_type:complete